LNFLIVSFPSICPIATAYGVHYSVLIGYFRACGSYTDFIDRGFL